MEKYFKDESGQWWCETKKQRQRVNEQTCEQCGKKFVNRHKQKCCSKACTGISQRGNRRGPRACAWCKKLFTPPARENRKKCCSLRCAYDLGNTKRGRRGSANGRWKGGVKSHAHGYVRIYVPDRGYLLQHRVVMEKAIGRRLQRHEEVHHKNAIRHDNRIENLELWIKRQPGGCRAADLIAYAKWIMATYGPLESKLT